MHNKNVHTFLLTFDLVWFSLFVSNTPLQRLQVLCFTKGKKMHKTKNLDPWIYGKKWFNENVICRSFLPDDTRITNKTRKRKQSGCPSPL